jgi:hypothetical protein
VGLGGPFELFSATLYGMSLVYIDLCHSPRVGQNNSQRPTKAHQFKFLSKFADRLN